MNIPTKLTLLRFLSVPVLVFCFFVLKMPIVNVCLFMAAAATDWLDGYTARRQKQETELGKFLDPVADKILVVTVLVMISNYYHLVWVSIPAMIIISREIFISALREWLAKTSSKPMDSSYLAKAKTMVQMLALTVLIYQPSPVHQESLWLFGVLLLCVSAVLAVVSMLNYIKNVWPLLTFTVKQE